jgi:hypothetical protein
MIHTCSKCSRANPSDAQYCYYDGFVLGGGGSRNGGPVAVGSQAFSSPFVFPSGRACRNFNELALACQEEWDSAKEMLQQGFLGTFLGGLGRMDLVMAAREAAKFPDPDRGLDQLLSKLPADSLGAPVLKLETQEINLGILKSGEERRFALHLENQGMRLLQGSVSCSDGVWLTFGEGPGTTQKHFQFRHDMVLPIHIASDRLRASNKPVEAKLVLETNGGAAAVLVRAEVPVKPFPPGVLGGAKSPRQVAEKARDAAKEAAPLFERGEVRDWYKSNGWTYPVQGPDASGLGAVQQFFEALGLTPAPKVDISDRSITLRGKVGENLTHTVKVETPEKKAVYAHGVSDEPWLEVGRAKLQGRTATIQVTVPSVPDKPGETIKARLTVQANGNQRFHVPVTLEISGKRRPAMVEPVDLVEPVEPVLDVVEAVQPEVPLVVEAAEPPSLVFEAPAPPPPKQPIASSSLADLTPDAPSTRRSRRNEGSGFIHALWAAGLAIAVLIVVIFDLIKGGPTEAGAGTPTPPDGKPPVAGAFGLNFPDPIDPDPLLQLAYNSENRFGLIMPKVADTKNPAKKKRLSFWEQGDSNNTIVQIDGSEYYFGRSERNAPGNKVKAVRDVDKRGGKEVVYLFTNESIEVTQYTQVVTGNTGKLDTCVVLYRVKNYGTTSHKVGVRVMFDTYIGSNDGVPFTIPGEKGFLTTQRDFDEKRVPQYIEVIENPGNPKDHGVIARMGLRGISPAGDLEDPDRLVIAHFPGKEARWEPDFKDMEDDSCVFIYYPYRVMNAREERRMAFTYGLSDVNVTATTGAGQTQLALSAPSVVAPNTEFILTAYVWGGKKGQTVTLQRLPEGLSLSSGESPNKVIDDEGQRVQVSWKLKAGSAGQYEVQAASGGATTKPYKITVKATSIFG